MRRIERGFGEWDEDRYELHVPVFRPYAIDWVLPRWTPLKLGIRKAVIERTVKNLVGGTTMALWDYHKNHVYQTHYNLWKIVDPLMKEHRKITTELHNQQTEEE